MIRRSLVIAAVALILAFLLQLVLPWWSLAIAALLASVLFARSGKEAMLGSLLGIFCLWTILAAIIDVGNDSILSQRVADVFFVQRSFLLVLVTGIVGGLAATLPGLCGFYLRQVLSR